MTGLELVVAGVAFERRKDGRLAVSGPPGAVELKAAIDRAVEARRTSLGRREPRLYHCDRCGDRIGHDVSRCEDCPICAAPADELPKGARCPYQSGGDCLLCQLALQRDRDARAKK